MKVASFHVEERQSEGVAEVFLTYGVMDDYQFYVLEEEELDWDTEAEFEFESQRQKLFSVVNSTFSQGRSIGSELSEMYYVIQKDQPDIMDYYFMIQKYITEFCEFIDQDYAIYFKVNTL